MKMPDERKRKISDRVRQFVLENIDSVELLEVLRLLASDPTRAWSPDQVSRELRSSPTSIAKRLADLGVRGILEVSVDPTFSYRFAVQDPELRATVEELVQIYPQFRSRLIRLIYSKPNDKITVFADAFRFRERDDG